MRSIAGEDMYTSGLALLHYHKRLEVSGTTRKET